jgi:DNA invertase Pin-like site-specific DNA recombinase
VLGNFADYKMEKSAIELIRVSTAQQAGGDRASIPAQRAVNHQTATRYGLQIVRSIEIADVSGAAVLKSAGMQALLVAIKSPAIHGVVAREFSRLMRPENFGDYVLLQAFVESKTILYLPDGPIDFSNKSGCLLGAIRAAMAGMERTEILERIWSAKEAKRRSGKNPQSAITLPFGVAYDRLSEKWHYTSDAEKVREAFRLIGSGNVNYKAIGERVGIPPCNLRVILRNPIYTGWRVIDRKRDSSPAAHRSKDDGRQADRPKIMRSTDEIIRIQVIDDPLISPEDFQRAQMLMDAKKLNHWRTREGYEHRFVYNGFLNCALCGRVIYTHFRRADYYICSGRKMKLGCTTSYMRRENLEPRIDILLSERFTEMAFLKSLAEAWHKAAQKSHPATDTVRLQGEISVLREKRRRIIELFIDGLIERPQRDVLLRKIDVDLSLFGDLLMQQSPAPELTPEQLAAVFEPFREWQYLSRQDKRQLLAVTMPSIFVQDYEIAGIKLPIQIVGTGATHTDKDSLRQPA